MSARAGWPEGVGRRILGRVDSTNAEGLRLLAAGEGPVWVLAREQTAGRGRRGRPWSSPAGNFYATFAMVHDDVPARAALRSFTAALALREALAATTGHLTAYTLKWPNDVLLLTGKVAGILLEASTIPGGSALCVGIGVNLMEAPDASMLEPGAAIPVCVYKTVGYPVDPEALLNQIAPAFARWEHILVNEGFAPVREEWLAHAARLGQPIRARTGQAVHEGTFRGIDETGALVLDTARGPLAVPAAEVFF